MNRDEPIFTALTLTPEMTKRLKPLITEVLKLVQSRTNTPEEAFIVLDAVTRKLAMIHSMVLVAPIDGQIGST
jgi:hypothetical protein